MRFVITGTGRSGTGWCAAVLNSAGVFTGHERVFTPKAAHGGLLDWCGYHADASWLAVPRLPLMGVESALVVRHPLEVVESLTHIRFGVVPHVNEFTDIAAKLGGMTPDADGYLRFWVNWNTLGMRNTHTVFRLDDLLAEPTLLTKWAGARYEPRDTGIVNERAEWKDGDRPQIGWDEFTNTELVDTAQALWDSL